MDELAKKNTFPKIIYSLYVMYTLVKLSEAYTCLFKTR